MKKLTFLFFGIFFIIFSCKKEKEKEDFRDAYIGTYALECESYQRYLFPMARDITLIEITVSKATNGSLIVFYVWKVILKNST